jgi:hypothetical protein
MENQKCLLCGRKKKELKKCNYEKWAKGEGRKYHTKCYLEMLEDRRLKNLEKMICEKYL